MFGVLLEKSDRLVIGRPIDVNGANVGVVQRGSSLGFAFETRQRLRIPGYVVGKKLERDAAVQTRVARPAHHAHSTAAEPFCDAVVGDGLTDQGVGARHGWGISVGLAATRRQPRVLTTGAELERGYNRAHGFSLCGSPGGVAFTCMVPAPFGGSAVHGPMEWRGAR